MSYGSSYLQFKVIQMYKYMFVKGDPLPQFACTSEESCAEQLELLRARHPLLVMACAHRRRQTSSHVEYLHK